jgi:PilZ domain
VTGRALGQVVEADYPWDSFPNRGNRRIMTALQNTELRLEVSQRPDAIPERRQQPRHRLRDAPGTLGWCDNEEQIKSRMTVISISGAGASVVADRCPTVGQPVWIRLDSGAVGSERLDARVVSTSTEAAGMSMVRMQFTSWLPLGNVLDQHEEHRLWQRYPARETRASLIWLDRDIEQTFPGELMNISGGGAAVITSAMVPAEQPVWLTLGPGADTFAPVESRLVAISIDASGLRIARLRFVEPCPMQLFELAVHGTPSQR